MKKWLPLNLITGCATLCSNKCNQAFAITGNESFTSLCRNFVIQVLKPQSITLPPPLTVVMMFFLWNAVLVLPPDVTGHAASKKSNCCLISLQNICPKVKCETSLCVLFGQQWLLPWNSPLDAVFAQSLSHCWIMNTDLNWGKWGQQFFRWVLLWPPGWVVVALFE